MSATWAVPANAVSGIYIAKLEREDGTAGSSHIVFVVRDDDGRSDMLFQTSDTTWQAYNQYGGNSLYTGGPGPPGGAYKVSYNRPFTTRDTSPEDWVFNAEYPMVRWLERNGYDVTLHHRRRHATARAPSCASTSAFLSVGHDEYWSAAQRANVEAARDAGCQPRVLQRQRDLLEDPLGAQHRRARDPVPHAGHLQGDARQRARPIRDRDLDGHLARPALQPARRRAAGPRTR